MNRPIHVRLKRGAFLLSMMVAACLSYGQRLPGVVVTGRMAFAAAPDGGIQAIDMQDGSILWTNTRAVWPLAVGQGKVIVLSTVSKGNNCTVAFLDVSSGKSLAEVGPVQFAPWAPVRFEYYQRSESSFRLWVQSLTQDGALILWKAERWEPLDLRHLKQAQQKQYASGRITVEFARNAVSARFGPVSAGPDPVSPPDKSLPLLRGQRAISSIFVGNGDTMLALVSTGSDVNLQCFKDRLLKWSVAVAKK